jgi:hypothetical protein
LNQGINLRGLELNTIVGKLQRIFIPKLRVAAKSLTRHDEKKKRPDEKQDQADKGQEKGEYRVQIQ